MGLSLPRILLIDAASGPVAILSPYQAPILRGRAGEVRRPVWPVAPEATFYGLGRLGRDGRARRMRVPRLARALAPPGLKQP